MGTHQDQFRGFAKYNREFNQSLFEHVAKLGDEQRRKDMGAFFGSIHGTLNHILLADRIWLGRFAKAFPELVSLDGAALVHEVSSLRQEVCADFAELARERRATDEVIVCWVEELSDALLARTMRYGNTKRHVRELPVWLVVAHMFNHQTHHRGQVTTLLSQLGHDPGVTDYLVYAQ
ncbi:MAG TPA: DinB family protein [Oleiagrimonas sp.]|nr:DinB family protein [Oleiagrimonas sp.]